MRDWKCATGIEIDLTLERYRRLSSSVSLISIHTFDAIKNFTEQLKEKVELSPRAASGGKAALKGHPVPRSACLVEPIDVSIQAFYDATGTDGCAKKSSRHRARYW